MTAMKRVWGGRLGAALHGGVTAAALGISLLGVARVASALGPDAGDPSSSSAAAASHVQEQDSFPHLDHRGLFPLCEGCHEGISEEDEVTSWPEPALCSECHDGEEYDLVQWSPPTPVVGPLDFSHAEHLQQVAEEGEEPVLCADCHVAEGGERLEIVPLEAERCMECHSDQAPEEHFTAGTQCSECHRVVAEVEAGDDLMREYSRPDDYHRGRDFLLENHGLEAQEDVARCATCHVEDQCAGCHVDASLDPIPQVPRAPETWNTPRIRPHYPEPASHDEASYQRTHGRPAPDEPECSTCHTQNDCAACHLSPLPPSAEGLQERPQVRAPGAMLEDRLPASHETPFFNAAHPVLAASGPDGCASCHTESYCSECHNAPQAPGYHPPNFALRHSAAVGSQPNECSNCHNAANFCRDCHTGLGLQSVGRLGAGFHDAEPVWLLRHGTAARQGLEQCASCHTQQSCLQCHSQLGAFKVNPHGPEFDPERAQARNGWICRACHIGEIG